MCGHSLSSICDLTKAASMCGPEAAEADDDEAAEPDVADEPCAFTTAPDAILTSLAVKTSTFSPLCTPKRIPTASLPALAAFPLAPDADARTM